MTANFEALVIADHELRASARLDGTTVVLALVGTADTRSMAALDAMLKQLHESTRASGSRKVVVNLRELEFMNSSCFKAFVTWVSAVRAAPAEQYKMEFLSDDRRHWQRRSLGALACFAVDLITVAT